MKNYKLLMEKMESTPWYKEIYHGKSIGDVTLVEQSEQEIILGFAKRFVESQQDMPRDIAEIVQKHFWDLI